MRHGKRQLLNPLTPLTQLGDHDQRQEPVGLEPPKGGQPHVKVCDVLQQAGQAQSPCAPWCALQAGADSACCCARLGGRIAGRSRASSCAGSGSTGWDRRSSCSGPRACVRRRIESLCAGRQGRGRQTGSTAQRRQQVTASRRSDGGMWGMGRQRSKACTDRGQACTSSQE